MGFLGLSDVRRFSAIQMRSSADDDRRLRASHQLHATAVPPTAVPPAAVPHPHDDVT